MPLSADSPHTTEIVLFGVRVKVWKESGEASGYASVDDAAPKPFASFKPKRGTPSPWTEEEHKQFLVGLEKLRKGDWKGISHNYVKTRTPIQVASHAQKYFLYHSKLNHRRNRRRPSLFEMPTESVIVMPREDARDEQQIPAKSASVPQPVTSNVNVLSTIINNAPVLLSMQGGNPLENCQSFLVNNSSTMFVHHLEPASSSRAMNMRAYHNYKHS